MDLDSSEAFPISTFHHELNLMSFENIHRNSVISALNQFDHLGRSDFLKSLNFSKAVKFFILFNGKEYDCKPIFWAAYILQYGTSPKSRATGGVNKRIRPILEKLGFHIVAKSINARTTRLPEEVFESELWEGAKMTITVNKYERSEAARRLCIEAHGSKCAICNFDFSEEFGDAYAGFIHVHHIFPLSVIGESYIVNPKTDLVPLCPNCHAAIHYGGNTKSLPQLKKERDAAQKLKITTG